MMLTKDQTTKGTSVFSRPAQSQHIPKMLASANKGSAHTEKKGVMVGALTQRTKREGGVGVTEEERGQYADH